MNLNSIARGERVLLRRLDRAIPELDRIEGFIGYGAISNLFTRRLVECVDDNQPAANQQHFAWAWFLDRDPGNSPAIASGCWRSHLRSRDADR